MTNYEKVAKFWTDKETTAEKRKEYVQYDGKQNFVLPERCKRLNRERDAEDHSGEWKSL